MHFLDAPHLGNSMSLPSFHIHRNTDAFATERFQSNATERFGFVNEIFHISFLGIVDQTFLRCPSDPAEQATCGPSCPRSREHDQLFHDDDTALFHSRTSSLRYIDPSRRIISSHWGWFRPSRVSWLPIQSHRPPGNMPSGVPRVHSGVPLIRNPLIYPPIHCNKGMNRGQGMSKMKYEAE